MGFVSPKFCDAQRVYAVGDIHGCAGEFEVLLRFLEEQEGVGADDLVVFLGDYIDRGDSSKDVVELAVDFGLRHPSSCFLKGNHEDMLLDLLGFGGNLGHSFLYNGGIETIQSYGMTIFAPPSELAESFPPKHFDFFLELESCVVVDPFVFVHAGLNPLKPFDRQDCKDLYWVRDEFVDREHDFDYTVIFGHTPQDEVFLHMPYKVGIDTGLVYGNSLTCLEVVSGGLFQVRSGRRDVVCGDVAQLVRARNS